MKTMKQFEYKYVTNPSTSTASVCELFTELGKDGWRYIGSYLNEFIFEREIIINTSLWSFINFGPK